MKMPIPGIAHCRLGNIALCPKSYLWGSATGVEGQGLCKISEKGGTERMRIPRKKLELVLLACLGSLALAASAWADCTASPGTVITKQNWMPLDCQRLPECAISSSTGPGCDTMRTTSGASCAGLSGVASGPAGRHWSAMRSRSGAGRSIAGPR